MTKHFFGILSAWLPKPSSSGLASWSHGGICDEETFRCLVKNETKRSERSGHPSRILFLYLTDAGGSIVRMDDDVAGRLASTLFVSVRETDYVGWDRHGFVVGVVLTVMRQGSVTEVSEHIERRLAHILRSSLPQEIASRIRFRLCPMFSGLDEGAYLNGPRIEFGDAAPMIR
jgi:hypothetical protein